MRGLLLCLLLSFAAYCQGDLKCYNCLGLDPAGNSAEMSIVRGVYDQLRLQYPNLTLPDLPDYCGLDGATYGSNNLILCDGIDTCSSMNVHVDFSADNVDRTIDTTLKIKGCGLPATDSSCKNLEKRIAESRAISVGLKVSCETCGDDACNSGIAHSASFAFIIVAVVAKIF